MTRRKYLRNRSTGEILVLMVAVTVCGYVIAVGTSIVVVAIIRPEQDTFPAAVGVRGVINTLIGLLAGFLAGRTDVMVARKKDEPPEDEL